MRRGKLELAALEDGFGQTFHKVENARFRRLVLAEGLVIHENVDHFFLFRQGIQPIDKVLSTETVLHKAEGNLIAELEIAQQDLQFRVDGVGIHVVGTLPAQDVLRAFGEYEVVAHIGHCRPDFVAVNQLGVAESFRRDAKHLFHLVLVGHHLTLELIGIRQRSQRVGVCLRKHLNLTRRDQFLETF